MSFECALRCYYAKLPANRLASAWQFLSDADGVLGHESAGLSLEEDDEDCFSPERGNVAFGSAYDGWAFRTETFAEIYAPKLGVEAKTLARSLWGEWFYNPKLKRVVGRDEGGAPKGTPTKNMFVQASERFAWEAKILRPKRCI